MKSAEVEESAAMRKRPLKLSRVRLLEVKVVSFSVEHWSRSPNHAFLIKVRSGDSVTFRIALDMSGTRGDPFGNA